MFLPQSLSVTRHSHDEHLEFSPPIVIVSCKRRKQHGLAGDLQQEALFHADEGFVHGIAPPLGAREVEEEEPELTQVHLYSAHCPSEGDSSVLLLNGKCSHHLLSPRALVLPTPLEELRLKGSTRMLCMLSVFAFARAVLA